MKTNEALGVYNALISAKLTKMGGDGKIKIVKIIKALKPVATAFDDFRKDAAERLKPEGYEEKAEKAEKWRKEGDKSTLTATEKAELNQFFADYNMEIEKCLKEESEKDNDIAFAKLTSDEFMQLCDGNDWVAGVMLELMEYISE